jgi:cytochrome c peroxidase
VAIGKALAAWFAVAAFVAQAGVDNGVARLQGRWVVTAAELQQQPFPAVVGGILTIASESFVIRTAGGNVVRGTLQVGSTALPGRIDLVHADGSYWEGIYTVDGTRLRLAYVDVGSSEPRPTAFATSLSSEAAVLELRRDTRPSPRATTPAALNAALVELGRHLFYDTRLSGNGTQSCATCHQQDRAFTDGRARGLGSTGELHLRSPMSLINVAFRGALTWSKPDLRSLEEQALVPMLGTDPIELGLGGHESRVYGGLADDARYTRLFAAAFPAQRDAVTTVNVAAALAEFQRSIVSVRSPFDRYRDGEDDTALSPAALRGSVLFFSGRKARCFTCHRGANLDGDSYLNTGVNDDAGTFRVPTLRNVAVTAPYMHDGSIANLEEVLDHYVAGGRVPRPDRPPGLQPLTLTGEERRDLLAFLESLTDREALIDPRWSNPWR